ncbi:hypothetical protein [Nocardia arizonensis]|uniref:hypothetical protein n=1 Tax=Nocardia arizonensis TaxID=1141647 RepID=UPI000B203E82|nr:hypothetical protein [Nocardia arizonensis]
MPEPSRTAPYPEAIHDNPVYEGSDPAPEAVPEQPDAPVFETFTTGVASLRGGEIVVTATDSGLPTEIVVTPEQLRRDPDELAGEILRLCRLATDRAGVARREYLTNLGLGEQALSLLGLPTAQLLAQSELADEAEHDYEPRSWLDQGGSTW